MLKRSERNCTVEEKLRILEKARQPKTAVAEVFHRHQLDVAPFYRWERQAKQGMEEAPGRQSRDAKSQDREIERLRAELERKKRRVIAEVVEENLEHRKGALKLGSAWRLRIPPEHAGRTGRGRTEEPGQGTQDHQPLSGVLQRAPALCLAQVPAPARVLGGGAKRRLEERKEKLERTRRRREEINRARLQPPARAVAGVSLSERAHLSEAAEYHPTSPSPCGPNHDSKPFRREVV